MKLTPIRPIRKLAKLILREVQKDRMATVRYYRTNRELVRSECAQPKRHERLACAIERTYIATSAAAALFVMPVLAFLMFAAFLIIGCLIKGAEPGAICYIFAVILALASYPVMREWLILLQSKWIRSRKTLRRARIVSDWLQWLGIGIAAAIFYLSGVDLSSKWYWLANPVMRLLLNSMFGGCLVILIVMCLELFFMETLPMAVKKWRFGCQANTKR